MDRTLVLKLLGKKNSVDLEDMVYNLREITEELRECIILSLPIDEDTIARTNRRLNVIHKVILTIKDDFAEGNNVPGYTNSKVHLNEFISSLCTHTDGLIKSFQPFDNKVFIYHTNVIIDLVLDY